MDPEQRRFFAENGYLIVKDVLDSGTVSELNAIFVRPCPTIPHSHPDFSSGGVLGQERQLREEKPPGALSWYLNREREHLLPDGTLSPRRLWSNALICPPKMEPILREVCASFEFGHLHPDCPEDKRGGFRLDGDGAHWIAPFDPDHSPDPAADFPPEPVPRPAGGPYPGMHLWSPDGIIQDGFHGGPPLYHISCLYELQPIGPGEGGFVRPKRPQPDCVQVVCRHAMSKTDFGGRWYRRVNVRWGLRRAASLARTVQAL